MKHRYGNITGHDAEMLEVSLARVVALRPAPEPLRVAEIGIRYGETARGIKHWLDEHFHRYRLLQTSHCNLPLEILLAAGRFDPALSAAVHSADVCDDSDCGHDHHHHHVQDHAHDTQFSTWSYHSDRPMSLEALRTVAARLPSSIYRCKGVIHSADSPGRRAVLQVVGKRVDIALADEWGERPPRTRIVAIGAHGAVNGDAMGKWFAPCIADGNRLAGV